MPKPVHSSVRLDTEIKVRVSYSYQAQIRALAKSQKKTVSTLIRELLDREMDEHTFFKGAKWARDQQPNCIFETSTDTSSATICKHCGREKWEHQQPTPVVSEEELRINAHKGLEEEWTQIERIRFVDGFFACHEWLQSRPQANEGLFKEEDK